MRRVTRTKLENAEYPTLIVYWKEDEDGLGWRGQGAIWTDSRLEGPVHRLHLRQSTPLGSITLVVDEIGAGCWAMTIFEGVGLNERDLQWAAAYAGEAIKRKEESTCNVP